METLVDNQSSQNSSRLYQFTRWFWFAYFMLSIGIIGAFLAYGLCLPLHLLSRWFPRLQGPADRVLQRGVSLLMHAQPWFSLRVEGMNVCDLLRQKRPLLFVSNHRSHLDVFILLTLIPGIRVLAKKSLFSIPGLAAIMRASRQIPVESGRLDRFLEAMECVRHEVGKGERVHVFPELTRCPKGSRSVRVFSTAPFKAAREARAMVVPVVFHNTDCSWPKGEIGIGWSEMKIQFLTPVDSLIFPSATELSMEIKRQIEGQLI